MDLTEASMDTLAEKLARKMLRLQDEKKSRDEEKKKTYDGWEVGSEFFRCIACSSYSTHPDVPKQFARQKKRAFGIIRRNTEQGERRKQFKVKLSLERHCETDLHKWFATRSVKEKERKLTYEETNRKVGENVIRAALKAFKRGLGAQDFQADIDFLNMTPGVPNSHKNNSRTAFFNLRDDAFEVVSENIKELFHSGKVQEMAATLDKVTIHHKSYTVLLTFFFYEGRIYCLLNELLIMKEDEYTGEGTATMVVRSLMDTLGLGRTRLAGLLTHFAMDGVYVETEQ